MAQHITTYECALGTSMAGPRVELGLRSDCSYQMGVLTSNYHLLVSIYSPSATTAVKGLRREACCWCWLEEFELVPSLSSAGKGDGQLLEAAILLVGECWAEVLVEDDVGDADEVEAAVIGIAGPLTRWQIPEKKWGKNANNSNHWFRLHRWIWLIILPLFRNLGCEIKLIV